LVSACNHAIKQPEKFEKYKQSRDVDFLLGKTIKSIDSILSVKCKENYIVYIFNSNDCGSCVNEGFSLLKKLTVLYTNRVYAITPSLDNPAFLQKDYDYYEYIYRDNNDLIRRELKYIPTPVFLLLDSANKILNIHFPENQMPEYNQTFMKICADALHANVNKNNVDNKKIKITEKNGGE
jgi:hypothetical protein